MRFIGGKSLLLDHIDQVIQENICDEISVVGDLFSGSGVVAQHFKSLGYQVISNDIMYMSYVLARGFTEMSEIPSFEHLAIDDVFEHLNSITDPLFEDSAFVSNNYAPNGSCCRMYFQPENARRIDGIRQQIEVWKDEGSINESEYYYLLACLISAVPYVANITGVYAAYLKHWDKRTYNTLCVQPFPVIHSERKSLAFNLDATVLCQQYYFDIAYIDPPYNQREYAPNYHVLETIARYDNPEIHGITGMRKYEKSRFCSASTVRGAFEDLFSNLRAKYAIVSYNNEGLLDTNTLISIFSRFGEVTLYEFPYRRYKSKIPNNENGLKEQLFFVRLEQTK